MAKIDVIIPCYNYGRFLDSCVRSVLQQSVSDLRVLIIDDASSDESPFIANRIAATDKRVSVILHANNQGHIQTFNEGIDWADSEYFLLLSADDLLVPGALERAIAVMDENPDIGLTYGESVVWYDHHPFPGIDLAPSYTWERRDIVAEMCGTARNFVPTPTAIARTSCQKAIGGYRAFLYHSGDMEMWLRFASHSAVARINTVQAIYRKHESAMSNPFLSEVISDYQQRKMAFDSFFESYTSRLPKSRALQVQAHQSLAYRAFESGIELLRQGRVKSAFSLFRWSINLDSRLLYTPPLQQLFKLPGPDGRQRALSAIRKLSDILFGTLWSSILCRQKSERRGN